MIEDDKLMLSVVQTAMLPSFVSAVPCILQYKVKITNLAPVVILSLLDSSSSVTILADVSILSMRSCFKRS